MSEAIVTRGDADVQNMLIKAVEGMLAAGPARIGAEDDLARLGLTSLDMVSLMLTVEAKFALTIPPAEINPQNFRSVAAIAAMVERLPAR